MRVKKFVKVFAILIVFTFLNIVGQTTKPIVYPDRVDVELQRCRDTNDLKLKELEEIFENYELVPKTQGDM